MNPKTRKLTRLITGTASAVFLVSGIAMAIEDPPPGSDSITHPARHRDHGSRGARGLEQLLDSLKLTDTQRTGIRQILDKNRPNVQPLVDDMIAARRDVNAAVQALAPSESAIRAATERLVQAQTAIALQRARIASEIRSTLTPEQQKTFDEQRAQIRDRVTERVRHRRQAFRDGSDDDSHRSEAKERSDDDSSSASK